MAQSTSDPAMFSVSVDPGRLPTPSDVLRYRIIASDAGDNSIQDDLRELEWRLFQETELLESVWATNGWEHDTIGWVKPGRSAAGVDALILSPRNTESNASSLRLLMDHEPHMGRGFAGLVQVSTNDGDSWATVTPEGGYGGQANLGTGSILDGQLAFTAASMRRSDVFEFDAFAGQQIQIRLLAESTSEAAVNSAWRVFSVALEAQTGDDAFSIPVEFELQPAFPNPFSNRTRLAVSMPESGPAELTVYDALGRKVAVLLDEVLDAGTHSTTFDASGLAGGVYLVRFQAGSQSATRTVVLVGQ